MPTESNLSKSMVKVINSRADGWARKVPGGPMGAGWPDIIGCYRGVMLCLETKLPGKEHTLTTLQRETLNKARAAGAFVAVVTAKSQVVRILDRIDEVKDKSHEHRTRKASKGR